MSPAQRLMKAFWNGTQEMKAKNEKRERSGCGCLSLSLFLLLAVLFLFSASRSLCKGIREEQKKITFVGACTTLISIFRAEASRPRVTSNCVSNWLLPMQLRLCHTRFFTVWGAGERSSFWRTTVALQQIWIVAVLLIFWRSCIAVITSDVNRKRKVTEVGRRCRWQNVFSGSCVEKNSLLLLKVKWLSKSFSVWFPERFFLSAIGQANRWSHLKLTPVGMFNYKPKRVIYSR